jgi:hypothetical protein
MVRVKFSIDLPFIDPQVGFTGFGEVSGTASCHHGQDNTFLGFPGVVPPVQVWIFQQTGYLWRL